MEAKDNKEIEIKYLISQVPFELSGYPFHEIQQGYLCKSPVVRIRKQDDLFFLTYKSKGLLERTEYNLPLTEESYHHLIKKTDGVLITKTRYLIPYHSYTIELDLFHGSYEGLILAEVEFCSKEEALGFQVPTWFDEDVTYSGNYQNSTLSDPATLPLRLKPLKSTNAASELTEPIL